MKRGRPAFTEQPDRLLCACGSPRAVNYKSTEGYTLYKSRCNGCIKRERVHPYRTRKKPHCESCGFEAKHSCQLDVHHLDGDHNNNDPNNLQTLCANCHRLIHFGGA